ncbi:MAG: transglycosylase SLT domain-containing protein [Myxococcota bacterium]
MLLLTLARPLVLAGTLLTVPASISTVQPEEELVEASVTVSPSVLVGDDASSLVLDLSESVLDHLRARRWSKAYAGLSAIDTNALNGPKRGSLAFVKAWALVHAGRAAEAGPLVDQAAGGEAVPKPYLDLVRGEVWISTDRVEDGLAALGRVPADSAAWARAQVVRGEALKKLGRTKEALDVLESLAARPDPADGSAEALLALATRAGQGSEKAYTYLRRVWEQYPKTEASKKGWTALKAYGRQPTWKEKSRRAFRLMQRGAYDSVIAEVGTLSPPAGDRSDEACQLLFAKGRSQYKKNRLSNSISAFADIGPRCADATEDWGARGLYLKGKAQFRRGQHRSSAATYALIPELYASSSYADDGWLHSGIALQEAGDLKTAQARWQTSLKMLPDGDTTPESTWRLAFSHYLSGQPELAIEAAEELGRLPMQSDRRHVEAGRYWSARWRMYPDVSKPTVATDVPDLREEAIAGWRNLCRELPHSYYSVLAYSRLVELAPDVAAELAKRPADHDKGELGRPWTVRLAFYGNPEVRAGIDLARLGLISEAKAAWAQASVQVEQPDEMALVTQLRIQTGDWLLAHDNMRRWLAHNPPGTLGLGEPQVLRVGYPDRYWDEVQAAAPNYRFEPRLFHALVREESNFNRKIRSFAGAMGLSQLMPATAKQTAGWLKRPVGDLHNPSNNLEIGAKYLDVVHKQLAGSPYLSLAGYNAGPHRQEQWVGEWGNIPTDEYVERIPFRETRGYVRRVTTTWQTYRYQFDEGPAFPDLSRFNHQAMPGRDG